MKGFFIILLLFALLVGGYLVYRNLSEQTSDEDDITRIKAIDKGREAAETLEKIQDKIHKRAQEATSD